MSERTIREIGRILAEAVDLEAKPVCVYGADRIPERGMRTYSISHCLASAMYQMATGARSGPLYAGYEQDQPFCRCMGGPAWFGYSSFDPRLMSLLASGSKELNVFKPKYLKENRDVAEKTISAMGKVTPLGRYVIMSCCSDVHEDLRVKCIVCFASSEQIRDLCALGHFGSHDAFSSISIPWGPSCATMVTYPAGMAENAPPNEIFVGPTDPSAREWLPNEYMAMGIPVKTARMMAEYAGRSFLTKSI
jgi:hypothetical protein